jgi:hypothetical protein
MLDAPQLQRHSMFLYQQLHYRDIPYLLCQIQLTEFLCCVCSRMCLALIFYLVLLFAFPRSHIDGVLHLVSVICFLHLSECFSKDDVCRTNHIYEDIVNQEAFYDTRYNHGIIMWVIFQLKVLMGEGDWNMRPFRSKIETLHSNITMALECLFL